MIVLCVKSQIRTVIPDLIRDLINVCSMFLAFNWQIPGQARDDDQFRDCFSVK
ncbi:MAG: hypothetical protein JWP12_3547 [Bacteroidetes bacterium]|nr:hypothetical protein [Bacteroidota bacterium]